MHTPVAQGLSAVTGLLIKGYHNDAAMYRQPEEQKEGNEIEAGRVSSTNETILLLHVDK